MEVVIQGYLAVNKHSNPFKNGIPREEWWLGFLKHHPNLVRRKLQQLQMVGAKATCQVVLDHWFKQYLELTLTKLKLKQYPKLIYNVDESGFPLSWTSHMTFTHCGDSAVQTCVPATIQYIVYTGEHVMSTNTRGGPLGA